MFNLHLLQASLTVEEYNALSDRVDWARPEAYLNQLPAYVIARCPFCLAENIERLDTYSVKRWLGLTYTTGESVFDHRAVVHHCQHFVLIQPFLNFHTLWPSEAVGKFGPEVPHVIGYLLENYQCLAVIHALPVCRIEGQTFVPCYTMFLISYFSEKPKQAYQGVLSFNAPFFEFPYSDVFAEPPDGREHWWNLHHWIEAGQLFWVDETDPKLGIRTQNLAAFPYRKITGRGYPYFHYFPRPLHQATSLELSEMRQQRIKAFLWEQRFEEGIEQPMPVMTIEWENCDYTGFVLTMNPVARLNVSATNLTTYGRTVRILVREIRRFVLRPDRETGLTELVLEVTYPPGERILGETDQVAEAERWVTDANNLLNSIRQTI